MLCRVCDGKNLELAIDLGLQPWCNHFLRPAEVGKEPFFPLRLVYCHGCSTAQLDYTVPKETMFGDHTYLSGVTASLSAHFREVAAYVDAAWFSRIDRKSVLDIGSNDGTQLRHYQALGYDVVGVEASRGTAQIANDNGVPTLNRFFNLEAARDLNRKFNVINAAGVFFHLEELHSVTDGIRECLADDGVFCVQFLYMKRILENNAFDQIYHEHLLYYNLKTIEDLLRRRGLSMFDAWLSPIHGGSIIGFATHAGRRQPSERLLRMREREELSDVNSLKAYLDFAKRIEAMKVTNLEWLHIQKSRGREVFGLGAPVKGNTMLNYFGVGPDLISCLVEKNPLRQGLFAPGSHIAVLLENEICGPPDAWYVLAWNFKKEILQRHQADVERGVEFYFPVDPVEIRAEDRA